MEQSRGRIISVADDYSRATVEVNSAAICSRCASGKGCGAGVFGSDSGPRRFEAPIAAQFEPQVGDEVSIELAPRSLMEAALVVYGAPLAGALVVTAIAYLSGFSDGAAALAACFGVVLGAFIGRRRLRRTNCLRQFTPVVTGRLAGTE